MSSETTAVPPPIIWAQNNEVIYLTINAECKEPLIKFTEDKLHFKGEGLPEKKPLEVTIDFLKKIKPEDVTSKILGRCIEFTIPKAKNEAYWDSLVANNTKYHWLKVDFNKWKDESEIQTEDSELSPDQSDRSALLNDLVGEFNAKSTNQGPSFDDLIDDEEDSDDDALPNLSN